MEVVSVVLAAGAAWIFGAIWYGVIGKQWMEASGLTDETINRRDPSPYIVSFLCTLVVAGMFRHVLATSAVTGVAVSAISGLGMGLFIAAPWIATNVMFSQRPKALIWMDGAYPAVGMTLMGIVFALF